MSEQQPSVDAARILTAAADRLATNPEQVLTATAWFEEFGKAASQVTDGMRIPDADLAIDIAWNLVPHAPTGATRTEWAEQLRRVASHLTAEAADPQQAVHRALTVMAAELNTIEPEQPLTNPARIALILRTTISEPSGVYDLVLMATAPIPLPMARGLYATALQRIAGSPTSEPTPRACGTCRGNGGQTVDTSSDGVTRRTWVPCQECTGTVGGRL
jgi:hypothetical protein